MRRSLVRFAMVLLLGLLPAGCASLVHRQQTVVPSSGAASPTPGVAATASVDPYALISQERLFAYLDDLTGIQPNSGWRNAATEGEAQALGYVAGVLGAMEHLERLGMEIERQQFRVYLATELWQTELHLTVKGQEVAVPASGLRGDRNDLDAALWFDADGEANDSRRDPVAAQGRVVLAATPGEAAGLERDAVRNAILLVTYSAVDPVVQGQERALQVAQDLLALRPAGIVLITEFSNEQGKSHGSFVGEGGVFRWVSSPEAPPILYARLEDLAPAGVHSWDDLAQVEHARMVWDADVLWPASSGNVVARIPGADSSRAVIISAHIDSPNSPGALDDGSGSVVLLEVARVLDAALAQPPVDVYLAWFGSEEIGGYGSAHFAVTHQELLDRTLGLLQIDMLSHPLDGVRAQLQLVSWSHGRFGDPRLLWPDWLTELGTRHGVLATPVNDYIFYSDNSALIGFDVPNADMIYTGPEMDRLGSVHYGAHVHDPYETVGLARVEGDVLLQMAHLALATALEAGQDAPPLRVSPAPQQRAVFLASHTEALHMSPVTFAELGMALALAGLDVDMVPYGQLVTEADLADAALVVALPVIDFADQAAASYDEAWTEPELDVLEQYVGQGGLLVLTDSLYRIDFVGRLWDYNEDWPDANALAERFGVSFGGSLDAAVAQVAVEHPLVAGIRSVDLSEGNTLGTRLESGLVLAQAGGQPAMALVDYGNAGGQVLVLADLRLLSQGWSGGARFWKNLAAYAAGH